MSKRKKINTNSCNTNTCPVKRATAFKTRMEGIATILKEMKWVLLTIVILGFICVAPKLGVDFLPYAEAFASSGVGQHIGNILKP